MKISNVNIDKNIKLIRISILRKISILIKSSNVVCFLHLPHPHPVLHFGILSLEYQKEIWKIDEEINLIQKEKARCITGACLVNVNVLMFKGWYDLSPVHAADALMRWCCWCIDALILLMLLMLLKHYFLDAADALLMHWCPDAADVLKLLMQWCCWCGDAAYALMTLMRRCC